MEPLVTTVSKAAKAIEGKRVVFEIFMNLSSGGRSMWPVEENVANPDCICMGNAMNRKVAGWVGRIFVTDGYLVNRRT
jgi:hypothetical protein